MAPGVARHGSNVYPGGSNVYTEKQGRGGRGPTGSKGSVSGARTPEARPEQVSGGPRGPAVRGGGQRGEGRGTGTHSPSPPRARIRGS